MAKYTVLKMTSFEDYRDAILSSAYGVSDMYNGMCVTVENITKDEVQITINNISYSIHLRIPEDAEPIDADGEVFIDSYDKDHSKVSTCWCSIYSPLTFTYTRGILEALKDCAKHYVSNYGGHEKGRLDNDKRVPLEAYKITVSNFTVSDLLNILRFCNGNSDVITVDPDISKDLIYMYARSDNYKTFAKDFLTMISDTECCVIEAIQVVPYNTPIIDTDSSVNGVVL